MHTVAQVEILQWFVKAGDDVQQFDRLCEVQSDKATVEISSPFVGSIVSLAYPANGTALTGEPLLHYVPVGATSSSAPTTTAPGNSGSTPTASTMVGPATCTSLPDTACGKVLATPATRALAREHRIDLAAVRGSGRDGRVTKEDVVAFLGAVQPAPSLAPSETAERRGAVSASAPSTTPPTAPELFRPPAVPSALVEDRVEPIKGIRKAMFAQMTLAHEVPAFRFCDEVRVDALMEVRKTLKPLAEKYGADKFTMMPLMLKAASLALAEFPIINSSISPDGSSLIYKAAHNIGLAMDTPTGLLVPNVKDVASKSTLEIALELQRLQTAASLGKLGLADLKDGTFSISNIGNLGGTYCGPIINVPEVCIVGLGKARHTPKFNGDGGLGKASIMQASWTADHRVIDGATMAKFSNAWIGYLEDPSRMLLHL